MILRLHYRFGFGYGYGYGYNSDSNYGSGSGSDAVVLALPLPALSAPADASKPIHIDRTLQARQADANWRLYSFGAEAGSYVPRRQALKPCSRSRNMRRTSGSQTDES